MEELQDAMRRDHDTSAGPDEIHDQLFKHLPSSSLLLLLNAQFGIYIHCRSLGKALKPLNKLKMHLHPNTLFLHTHFRVSKLYNI